MFMKYSESSGERLYVNNVYNNPGSYLGSSLYIFLPPLLQIFIKIQRSKIYNHKIIQHGTGSDLIDLKIQPPLVQITNMVLGKVVIC